MIYLINVTYYNKDTKEILDLLKIGYTDNWDKRKSQYLLHNPGIQELYLLEDGSEEQESKLHYKFKDLKYLDYGNEWFYYNEEIVNYIKTVALEELDKLPNSPNKNMKNSLKGKKEAKKIISYLFDTKEEINNYLSTLSDKLGDTISYTTTLDYISKDSTIDQDKLKNYYEIKNRSDTGIYTEDKELNIEVLNFLKEYSRITIMYDKLRYLCESSISQDAKNIVLAQLPESDHVKSYYTILGPARLRELGYSITKKKKELGIVTFSPEVLVNTIYSNFHVGEKYLLSNLKNLLSDLYYSISYKATPKAIDIMNYFEVKEFKVTAEIDGVKKRVRGYELVSSKEMEFRVKLDLMNKGEL